MDFRLDENFGRRTQKIFRSAGHNVKTVLEQGLQGCSDRHLYEDCCKEKQCLVTLDLDFADVIRFPPHRCAGIVVIRYSKNLTLSLLEVLIHQFLKKLSEVPIQSELWIVEIGRIRIHQSENNIGS